MSKPIKHFSHFCEYDQFGSSSGLVEDLFISRVHHDIYDFSLQFYKKREGNFFCWFLLLVNEKMQFFLTPWFRVKLTIGQNFRSKSSLKIESSINNKSKYLKNDSHIGWVCSCKSTLSIPYMFQIEDTVCCID